MEDVPNYTIKETFEDDDEMENFQEIFNMIHLGKKYSFDNKCKKFQKAMIKMHLGDREKGSISQAQKFKTLLGWCFVVSNFGYLKKYFFA